MRFVSSSPPPPNRKSARHSRHLQYSPLFNISKRTMAKVSLGLVGMVCLFFWYHSFSAFSAEVRAQGDTLSLSHMRELASQWNSERFNEDLRRITIQREVDTPAIREVSSFARDKH